MLNLSKCFQSCASFFQRRACKLIVVAFLLSLGGGYFYFQSSSYYFFIPVHSDEEYWGGAFVFQIEIEDKTYQLDLDLGTETSSLDREELDKIDKELYGTYSMYDVHGRMYEAPIYEVPKVKIHDLSLSMMLIREESPEFLRNNVLTGSVDNIISSGRAGRDIFGNKNFLLDFARSKMILCKRFTSLSRNGYHLKDFVKVPLHVNKIGFCLQADTDEGMKMLLLDTGCTFSLLRETRLEKQLETKPFGEEPAWHTNKFKIGCKDFGPYSFDFLHMSEVLSEIDGILGMDFLRKHAVFFDQDHLALYIEK